MKIGLTILDDFFGEPETVRKYALSHDFTQAPVFDGHSYPGFAPAKDKRFIEILQERLQEAIGGTIEVTMAAFVAGTEQWKTQQWIHADNNCAQFAGVLYLFDKPGFGTAFWRSNTWGTDGLKDTVKAYDVMTEERGGAHHFQPLEAVLQFEGQHADPWSKTDYADSRFNRMICYPTDRFHSRWPEIAFGDTPENCRLTLTCFFNLAP